MKFWKKFPEQSSLDSQDSNIDYCAFGVLRPAGPFSELLSHNIWSHNIGYVLIYVKTVFGCEIIQFTEESQSAVYYEGGGRRGDGMRNAKDLEHEDTPGYKETIQHSQHNTSKKTYLVKTASFCLLDMKTQIT